MTNREAGDAVRAQPVRTIRVHHVDARFRTKYLRLRQCAGTYASGCDEDNQLRLQFLNPAKQINPGLSHPWLDVDEGGKMATKAAAPDCRSQCRLRVP